MARGYARLIIGAELVVVGCVFALGKRLACMLAVTPRHVSSASMDAALHAQSLCGRTVPIHLLVGAPFMAMGVALSGWDIYAWRRENAACRGAVSKRCG